MARFKGNTAGVEIKRGSTRSSMAKTSRPRRASSGFAGGSRFLGARK